MVRALAAAIVGLAGCAPSGGPPPSEDVRLDLVEVEGSTIVVRTGQVGAGRWQTRATSALAEARNTTDRDLLVTLGGDLTGPGGTAIAPLRAESLRIPAGGTRVFALVDDARKERPAATSARLTVMGARTVTYPPPVVVSDGHVYRDGDRAVVAGNVVNTAAGHAKVIVIASFFDARGVPMTRPSTLFELDPGGKRGTQMVGPDGSRSATLFIGEVSY